MQNLIPICLIAFATVQAFLLPFDLPQLVLKNAAKTNIDPPAMKPYKAKGYLVTTTPRPGGGDQFLATVSTFAISLDPEMGKMRAQSSVIGVMSRGQPFQTADIESYIAAAAINGIKVSTEYDPKHGDGFFYLNDVENSYRFSGNADEPLQCTKSPGTKIVILPYGDFVGHSFAGNKIAKGFEVRLGMGSLSQEQHQHFSLMSAFAAQMKQNGDYSVLTKFDAFNDNIVSSEATIDFDGGSAKMIQMFTEFEYVTSEQLAPEFHLPAEITALCQ